MKPPSLSRQRFPVMPAGFYATVVAMVASTLVPFGLTNAVTYALTVRRSSSPEPSALRPVKA
ncbi:hypothetical protein RFM41_25295 [Mesorhizobium sp. VK25A]|uniref:Uncharacterized protein n=1 Tax=Mesorhizobium vachelliae TaxID=3072309 RepID=A0ABU5ABA2_9HYPH|nr:hypothetical protein [Mesorhizobium sp. VK25A]MDX8534445.1 hypothetical protein [Mesorhizobium sp. VK25D]MDX8547087.1 hypothetical protein [Mesorhizobium sp. VK25A]